MSSFESEWTVIWDTAAATFENGWIAELEIPFKTLPFDPAIETWGFNFGRGIRRRGEEMAWVSRNRSYNPSILGRATGFKGMDQGLGLDIVPAVSVNSQKAFSPSTNESSLEPSLDLFYRLTPSLNGSLTVNTDFSASEVDDRQVNLTRFNLFFPEKARLLPQRHRPVPVRPSRRHGESGDLGLQREQRATVLLAAAGTQPVGNASRPGVWRQAQWPSRALETLVHWPFGKDAFEAVDATTVLVGRVSANVLAESSIGMIATHGDPELETSTNSLYGFDFRYLNTRLPGGRVMEADAWFQQSSTDGAGRDNSAFGLGLRMPNNSRWRGSVGVKSLGENFDPALGFVSRSGIRETLAGLGYTHFTGGTLLQSVFFGVDAQRVVFIDGGLQSEVVVARLLELSTNTGESFDAHYTATTEVVVEPFTIYEDASRQVVVLTRTVFVWRDGTQRLDRESAGRLGRSERPVRRLSLAARDRNLGGDIEWRQSTHFGMGASYDWNNIELPHGHFITRLIRLTTEVNFSSTAYWATLIQYDNASEVLGANSRFVLDPDRRPESAGRPEPPPPGQRQRQLVPIRAARPQS